MVTVAAANMAPVVAWSVGLLIVLVVGLAFAQKLKKRLRDEGDTPAAPMGFGLSDLRQMHRSGQLTDEEFARARDKVVAAAQEAPEPAAVPGESIDRNSPDAIRARRLARETPSQDARPPAPPEQPGQAPS